MDMTVPDQVQRQMEDATRLHERVYGAPSAPSQPSEVNTDETPPAEPVAEPPVPKPEPQVEPGKPETGSDNFEAKYKVLEGKYRSEVPRLHQQNRELSEQVTRMAEQLDMLTRKQDEKAPEPEKPLVTDKDVEDFGADLVDMVRRAAVEAARKEISLLTAAIDKRFDAFAGQLGEVKEQVVETTYVSFWDQVKRLVPDWDAVDNDETWIAFLNERIPGTRKIRRQEAAEAIAAGDPEPIKELVDLWRSTFKPAEPVPPTSRRSELQQQVTPSTAKGTAPPQAPKIWSAAEYQYAFSQKAMHELRPQQLDMLQAEAQQALAEGRVRW